MKEKFVFDNLPWDNPKQGVSQKICSAGTSRLRLVRFEDDFIEEEWCTNAHIGFVLDGEMHIDFDGDITYYKKGDALCIGEGEKCKHKVVISKGKCIEIVLFEKNDNT